MKNFILMTCLFICSLARAEYIELSPELSKKITSSLVDSNAQVGGIQETGMVGVMNIRCQTAASGGLKICQGLDYISAVSQSPEKLIQLQNPEIILQAFSTLGQPSDTNEYSLICYFSLPQDDELTSICLAFKENSEHP